MSAHVQDMMVELQDKKLTFLKHGTTHVLGPVDDLSIILEVRPWQGDPGEVAVAAAAAVVVVVVVGDG
jgi:hypothetical protein